MILSIDETQDGTLADNHIYYAKAVMKFGSKLTQGTVVSVSQSVSSNKNLFCFCQKKRRNFFYIPCFRLGRVFDQRCLEYQMQN